MIVIVKFAQDVDSDNQINIMKRMEKCLHNDRCLIPVHDSYYRLTILNDDMKVVYDSNESVVS